MSTSEQQRSWLRLSGIFLSGLLIGVLLTLVIVERRAERFFTGHGGMMSHRFIHKLEQRLDLDEKQKQAWNRIVEQELRPQLLEMHQKQRQAAHELILGGLEKLDPGLTPAQQERLAAMRSKSHALTR